jgi:hypothetical protein
VLPTVFVVHSASRRADKPLSYTIAKGADAVVELPLMHTMAVQLIQQQRLDVLVYADTLSEPCTHFLSFSRLSPIQVMQSADSSAVMVIASRLRFGAIRSLLPAQISITSSQQMSWSIPIALVFDQQRTRTKNK